MRTAIPVAGLLVLAAIGYIKGAPFVAASPIDLTLVGACIVALALLVASSTLLSVKGLAPLIVLYLALLVGAAPAGAATDYSSTKVMQIAILVPLCLIGGRIILSTDRARVMWLCCTVGLGVVIAGLAIVFPDEIAAKSGQLSIEGSNTIGAARGVGAAVTVLVIWTLQGKRLRLACLLAAAGLVVVLLLIGSRGPILAAILAITVATLLSRQPGRPTRLLLVGLGIAAAGWMAIRESDQLSARLYTVQGDSADARINMWTDTLRIAGDQPFGIGWGQLYAHLRPGYVLSSGVTQYPHNLVLEVLVEAGWVPSIIVVAVIGYAFVLQGRAARTTTETAMLALLVFALVSAMVSGDVHSNREVWVALGAAMVWAGPVVEVSRPTAPSNGAMAPLPADHQSGAHQPLRSSTPNCRHHIQPAGGVGAVGAAGQRRARGLRHREY